MEDDENFAKNYAIQSDIGRSGIKSSRRKSVLRGKEHNRMQVETEIFKGASLASFLPSDIKLSCVGTAEN